MVRKALVDRPIAHTPSEAIGEISQTVRTSGAANKISSTPDPITPPGGQGSAMKSTELAKQSMDEFMAGQNVPRTS